MRVLVVDDDKQIVELLTIYLKNENYEIVEAYDGQAALDILEEDGNFQLILLDIMMPKVTGLQVLETMHQKGITIPVIILSAKSSPNEKIMGLMAGADDYVSKPFEAMEVIARIKSLIRRQERTSHGPVLDETATIDLGSIIVERDSHRVTTGAGKEVQLTSLEFDILYLLASHLNQVFSADEIQDKVWPETSKASSKTVMVHVSHLRDKLTEATGGEKIIQTVWGVGYKIVG